MRKALLVLSGIAILVTLGAINLEARTQYKSVIGKLKTPTKVEKVLQGNVKARSCLYCHGKKSKKVRTDYGEKLHDALGGGDRKKYKFDRKLWKKADGKYSPKAIKLLRDAIKAAAKTKKK